MHRIGMDLASPLSLLHGEEREQTCTRRWFEQCLFQPAEPTKFAPMLPGVIMQRAKQDVGGSPVKLGLRWQCDMHFGTTVAALSG